MKDSSPVPVFVREDIMEAGGQIASIEKAMPTARMLPQIHLSLLTSSDVHPKIPLAVSAAASGAVSAEEIPAANKPTDKKNLE